MEKFESLGQGGSTAASKAPSSSDRRGNSPFHEPFKRREDPMINGDLEIQNQQLQIHLERLQTVYRMTTAVSRLTSVEEIYEEALTALQRVMRADRSAILLFDAGGKMRFKCWRGISEEYRRAVDGHSPWLPGAVHPEPFLAPDVETNESLQALRPEILKERIRALAAIPLVYRGRLLGKFMIYYDAPRAFLHEEVEWSQSIAHQIAFAIEQARILQENASLAARVELQRQKLETLISNVPGIVWEFGDIPEEEKLVYVSRYAEQMLGYRVEEWLSRPDFWLSIVHPEDRDQAQADVARIFSGGDGGVLRCRWVARDGRILWVETRALAVRDASGRPVGMRCVSMDVTELKKAEDVLIQNDENQKKFIANVSHDFRTPLASIKGFSETLIRTRHSEKERKKFFKTIMRNVDRLETLVDDLLLLSSMEAGRLADHPEPIALSEFVRAQVKETEPLIRKRKNSMRIEIAPDLRVFADRNRLGKILQNLLSNSIKYNRVGGWIRVRAEESDHAVVVSVKDSGVGIAREDLPRIFERFYRSGRLGPEEGRNSGLGLHIVKELVESSGNRIWVNSAEGKGTTFYFALPGISPRPSPEAPAPGASPRAGKTP